MNAIKQYTFFDDKPAIKVLAGPLPKDVMTEKQWKHWGYKIDPRERPYPKGYVMINAIYYAMYDFDQVDIINHSLDAMRRRDKFMAYYLGIDVSEVV